jgi:hypothetical protein
MKRLYLVTLQKSTFSFYVLAEDETEAYQKVKKDLENLNYGASSNRLLDTIRLLAEEKDFPDTQNKIKKLYL